MTRIKRGGRELLVPDESVAEYLQDGYSVIDDKGNVLTHTQSRTYSELKAENNALKTKVKGLEAEFERLKADYAVKEEQIAALKAELETLKADTGDDDEEEPPKEPTSNKAGDTEKTAPTASTNKSTSGGKTDKKAK